jgi:hypothetical protein
MDPTIPPASGALPTLFARSHAWDFLFWFFVAPEESNALLLSYHASFLHSSIFGPSGDPSGLQTFLKLSGAKRAIGQQTVDHVNGVRDSVVRNPH